MIQILQFYYIWGISLKNLTYTKAVLYTLRYAAFDFSNGFIIQNILKSFYNTHDEYDFKYQIINTDVLQNDLENTY